MLIGGGFGGAWFGAPYFGQPHVVPEGVGAPVEIEETLTNSATSTQFITEYDAESGGSGGTGDPTLVEAIAETVSNSAEATFLTSDFETSEEENEGTGDPTISEAVAETVDNSASATISISDFQSEEESSTGTGDPTIVEAIAETLTNVGGDRYYGDGEYGEGYYGGDNQELVNEAIAEGVANEGVNDPNLEPQPELEPTMTNVGTGSQSLGEVIAEGVLDVSQESTQEFGEGLLDGLLNSAESTQELVDLEVDNPNNEGENTPDIISETIAETDTVTFLSTQSLGETITVRSHPFSDITTGTWTVPPLYEKVDELIALGGYPTESIRSSTEPVEDSAILGLQPVSDPNIDDNHYINIEFFKEDFGDHELNLTVRLLEGNDVIAERIFLDVTETEAAPRVERIALTSLEASAIVDYANLRIELVADTV